MSETPEQYTRRILGYMEGKEPLAALAATAKKLDRLITGVSTARLRKRPAPEKWSVSEIVAHVRRARTAVVVAPPGAGKTTRLPPALAELGRTILLQPRRVAARALARRIAAERGWSIGEEIGWQIRFERRFAHPVERVWDAITRPEQISKWWCGVDEVTLQLVAGGEYVMDMRGGPSEFVEAMRTAFPEEPEPLVTYWTVLRVEPPRVFVGMWSLDDNGNVPPKWTINGDQSTLRKPFAVALNPDQKELYVTDMRLNGVMTFSVPEIFEPVAR